MAPSYFEGPEKKFEIVARASSTSLLELGDSFWREVVTAARAEVLSTQETPECRGYLLSESSLFVFDRQVTMITCGRTTLVDAALRTIEGIGADNIELLIFERKNEHFPERQPTSFYDDAQRLHQAIPGRALRFGNEHDHRIFVFAAAAAGFAPTDDDVTFEILMHGIPPERAQAFRWDRGVPERSVAAETGLAKLLDTDVLIDEFAFEPTGYSLNALAGGTYYTVHVTPEREASYVSFETNFDARHDPSGLTHRVIEAFQPESFDILSFYPGEGPTTIDIDGYVLRKHVIEQLCGYSVAFHHYYRPNKGPVRAFPIELPHE